MKGILYKTLHLYNNSLFLRYLDWILLKLQNAFHFVEWGTQQWIKSTKYFRIDIYPA